MKRTRAPKRASLMNIGTLARHSGDLGPTANTSNTMKHTRALKPTFKRGDLAAAEHEATTLHKDALAALTTERVCDVQDDVDLNDWKYEVMNGDTVLGFQEWVEHKIEANSPSLGRTDPEVYNVDDLRRKLTQGQN